MFPTCKTSGLPNDKEPSDKIFIFIQNLDINTHESRDYKTEWGVQFTNKRATCLNVGWGAKVFSTEHKWIDRDAEVALTQLSFKAIYGDTKRIPQKKLVWQSPFYSSHQVTNYTTQWYFLQSKDRLQSEPKENHTNKPLSQERGQTEAVSSCVAPAAMRDSGG